MAEAVALHVLGVRHHGPGSARSVVRALDALQPDVVLVEGPPEGDALLAHLDELRPPVALLVYRADEPARAAFWPFARFSPEWQALCWARQHGVEAGFADLPARHSLAGDTPQEPRGARTGVRADPLGALAEAAGHPDPERWWEELVETRRDDTDLFVGLAEAMAALREDAGEDPPDEVRREAAMRRVIRAAVKAGHEQVAVVCGAWHAPALGRDITARHDDAVLKGLPKVKVTATWVPWSSARLTRASGYGAGIAAPGWYAHLWDAGSADEHRDGQGAGGPVATRWLVALARALRDADLPAPASGVVDAVRLAEALAALRSRPVATLDELHDAARAVLAGGRDVPLRVVLPDLLLGDAIGSVGDQVPQVPLAVDLEAHRKRLRLRRESGPRTVELDLRSATGLGRSHLFHRLRLLDVDWAAPIQGARSTGTFRETWELAWRPELEVAVVEAARWGTTVAAAATAAAVERAERSADLPALAGLVEDVLVADLPGAVGPVVALLEAEAAVATDVPLLLDVLGPLARVRRYGSVRGTDAEALDAILAGVVPRVAAGLPLACAGVDDGVASVLAGRLQAAETAVSLLDADLARVWREALARVAESDGTRAVHGTHGLLAGRALRLLLDAGERGTDDVGPALSRALSDEPAHAAAWIEGFLAGSGTVLLHDARLRGLLDGWLATLDEERFTDVLPLLRRTFATFPEGARRRLGALLAGRHRGATAAEGIDVARAERVLPAVTRLLGIDQGSTS